MSLQFLAFLALALPLSAVRDHIAEDKTFQSSVSPSSYLTANLGKRGLIHQRNSSIATVGKDARLAQGGCNRNQIESAREFCVSVHIPLVQIIKLELAMTVKFEHTMQNCFTFAITAVAGVKLMSYSMSFSLEYGIQQVPNTPETMCSSVPPGPLIVFSYIAGRILQYAKSEKDTPFARMEREIQEQLTNRQEAWADGKDPRISPTVLARSLGWIYGEFQREYQSLRQLFTPTSIPEIVYFVLKAFDKSYSYVVPEKPKQSKGSKLLKYMKSKVSRSSKSEDVETPRTCLELYADKAETDKWVWCYFTSMYKLSFGHYNRLIQAACEAGTPDERVWRHVKDTSLGILVEANAEVCADPNVDCVVTLPRSFVNLFPCFSWAMVLFMVRSDTVYHGVSTEMLLDAADIHGHFKEGSSLDLQNANARVSVAQAMWGTVVGNDGGMYSMTAEWSEILSKYTEHFIRLLMPSSEPGEGFVSDVDTDEKNFEFRETLSIAASGSKHLTGGFCQVDYIYSLTQTIDLLRWRSTQSCISEEAHFVVGGKDDEQWLLFVKPSMCKDWQTSAITTSYPVTLRIVKSSCTQAAFFQQVLDHPVDNICAHDAATDAHDVQALMQILLNAGVTIDTSLLSGSSSWKEMSSEAKQLRGKVNDAIQTVKQIVNPEGGSPWELQIPGVTLELDCAVIAQQTVDLATGTTGSFEVGYQRAALVSMLGNSVSGSQLITTKYDIS